MLHKRNLLPLLRSATRKLTTPKSTARIAHPSPFPIKFRLYSSLPEPVITGNEHFERAHSLAADNDFDAAIREFEKAAALYNQDPSTASVRSEISCYCNILLLRAIKLKLEQTKFGASDEADGEKKSELTRTVITSVRKSVEKHIKQYSDNNVAIRHLVVQLISCCKRMMEQDAYELAEVILQTLAHNPQFEAQENAELHAMALASLGNLYFDLAEVEDISTTAGAESEPQEEEKLNIEKAIECYTQAEKYTAELEKHNVIQTLYESIGLCYKSVEQYEKAITYFRKAVDAYLFQINTIDETIQELLSVQKKGSKGTKEQRKEVEMTKQMMMTRIVHLYHQITICHLDGEQPQEAYNQIRKAIRVCNVLKDEKTKEELLLHLSYTAGLVCIQLEKWKQAKLFMEAIAKSIANKAKSTSVTVEKEGKQQPMELPLPMFQLLSNVYLKLAEVYYNSEDVRIAILFLSKHASMLKYYLPEEGDHHAMVLENVGKAYHALGDLKHARQYLTRGIEIRLRIDSEDNDQSDKLASAYTSLAVMCFPADHEGALQYASKAVELMKEFASPQEMEETISNVAKQWEKELEKLRVSTTPEADPEAAEESLAKVKSLLLKPQE